MRYFGKKNTALTAGILISAVLFAVMLIGVFYTPYESSKMNGAEKFMAPCARHLMGTDNFGRDIFSRVLEGLGTTFFVAVSVTLFGSLFGVLLGAITGYFGGILDEILMRMNDVGAGLYQYIGQ